MSQVFELNIDGLVGPTHNYAGLSSGNVASLSNALTISKPAEAALQGIKKMRMMHQLGLKQAVMPPHQRPNLHLLQQLGFYGSPAEQVRQAKKVDINLLSACYSASSMWTANAATVSSSADTQDNRVHFSASNLIGNLHRHQEADFTELLLRKIFPNNKYFTHHSALPKTTALSDEGAANHNRLCIDHSKPGINLFVYGKHALPINNKYPAPRWFPARQTFEASQAIARKHLLDKNKVLFVCQNPDAIDQGVFHNDVIAVANENVLFLHQDGFLHQDDVITGIKQAVDFPIIILEVPHSRITITDAVNSYLFNSQLITLPHSSNESKKMALITPIECKQNTKIKAYIDEILHDDANPIKSVHYMNLRESMKNGGGPACLRLRVPITSAELSAMHQGVLVSDDLLKTLEAWVHAHYRPELHANDLDDPSLIDESFRALDELTIILQLGSIYPFQTNG